MRSGTAPARLVAMGYDAVLVRPPPTDGGIGPGVLDWFSALEADPLPGQVDVVPGAETVLIRFGRRTDSGQVRRWLQNFSVRTIDRSGTGDAVILETSYTGPDLAAVAELAGMSTDALIAAHTAAPWTVAFCGFAPGFGYLTRDDAPFTVPRLASPRPRIPAGSVGLAGEFSGVYPGDSPGGWQLIGHTAARLWDVRRAQPPLLTPGVAVQFASVREAVTGGTGRGHSTADSSQHDAEAASPALVVVRTGPQCVVQDSGRPGFGAWGVSPSGAADRSSAHAANAAVGNPVGAALLEIVLGGVTVQARGALTVAVTGAVVPLQIDPSPPDAAQPPSARNAAERQRTGEHGALQQPRADPHHREPAMGAPLPLRDGDRLRIGRPRHGLRTYLAVGGGIDVPPVLDSRSTDLLGGLGPDAVIPAAVLPVGSARQAAAAPPRDSAYGQAIGSDQRGAGSSAVAAERCHAEEKPGTCAGWHVTPGPQLHQFPADTWRRMLATDFTVSPASNRIAVRLAAADFRLPPGDELPSQGLVRGAIQVTPSGELMVFGADHPATGGYPVIAVATAAACDAAAQARPGTRVHLLEAASAGAGDPAGDAD